MAQYELNLRDYLRVLRKRRYYLVGPPVVLALITYLLTPRPAVSYRASSSVKISQSNTLAGLMLQVFTYSAGDNLATQTRILTSLPLMARLAQHLGRIPAKLDFKELLARPDYVARSSELQGQVTAEQVGTTSIIQISAEAPAREEAIAIANGLADVYVDWSVAEKNRQVIDAKKFIGEQVVQSEGRLREAEDRLRVFLEQNLDGLSLSAGELARLQEERERVRRLIETLNVQVDQLRERKNKKTGRIDWISSSELNDTNLQRFNTELIDLQLQKERLLVYQTESSPEVKNTENKIQTLIDNLVREYQGTLVELEKRAGQLDQKLSVLPQNDAELNRLKRDQQVANDAYTLLKSKYEEASIREAEKIRDVNVVEYATEAAARVESGKLSKTLVGALVGLALGFILALVAESMDTSIGTIEDVESYLGVSVLGVIPHIDREQVFGILASENPQLSRESLAAYAGLVTQFDPKSPVAEAYRSLRTNLEFSNLARPARSFLLTSSTLEEGKSTTAANLAVAFAQSGKRTLVVESDLRRPSIYTFFGLSREPGLTEVLLGTVRWQDAHQSIADVFLGRLDMNSLVRTPGLENLYFLTSGTLPPNPAELLGSAPMREFVQAVTGEFDVIIFDSPPVLPVTDAAIMSSQVDAVVLVYQLGRAGRGLLKRAKSHLDAVHADIRGVVLNDLKAEVSEFSPAEYYYQYYSRYERGSEKEPQGLLARAITGVRNRFGDRLGSRSRRTTSDIRPAASARGGPEYDDVLRVTDDLDRPAGKSH